MVLRLSVALSLVALLVLAGLQYHWIGQIAVAERQRLERRVAESASELAEDFTGELRSLAGVLEPRFSPADPVLIATRYHDWAASAAYPGLVKSIYIARRPAEVLRLDATMETFEPDSWPDSLTRLADYVAGRGTAPLDIDADLIVLPTNRRFNGPRGGRGPQGAGGDPARGLNAGVQDREPADSGWMIIELNHDVVVNQVLPRLVSQRFPDYEGRDYRVAIVSTRRGSEPHTIFTSGDSWSSRDLDSPDYALDVFTPALQRRGTPPAAPQSTARVGRGGDRGPRGPDQRGPMVTLAGQSWQILVKHRAGSVATAVMEFRRRNLAISFGIFVVLGISAVAIMVSVSRARRLGNLQMEFAAGISHELRTPLAVIQSAAHNLGSGVVRDREGIEEYAAIVKGEARRLTDMVEQVMAYTETQSGRKRYELDPVDIGDVLEAALRNMANVLRDGNASVRKDIEADLPPVLADAPALTRCLQNLLSNAVKYGRDDHAAEIEIEARHIPNGSSPGKIQVSVTDDGPGVPEHDVKHLFEAFHRGSNASTNTPGNGLGLHLVDRIMAAQNGSVTYERSATGGAKFTLTLGAAVKFS
jgi:signal transduction histidine kinase